jgi:hypothetical protein
MALGMHVEFCGMGPPSGALTSAAPHSRQFDTTHARHAPNHHHYGMQEVKDLLAGVGEMDGAALGALITR